MPQYNNQPEAKAAGIYRFRFYRMGEWMDIIIDDLLPKKHHAKVKDNEYWVPLVEKGNNSLTNRMQKFGQCIKFGALKGQIKLV